MQSDDHTPLLRPRIPLLRRDTETRTVACVLDVEEEEEEMVVVMVDEGEVEEESERRSVLCGRASQFGSTTVRRCADRMESCGTQNTRTKQAESAHPTVELDGSGADELVMRSLRHPRANHSIATFFQHRQRSHHSPGKATPVLAFRDWKSYPSRDTHVHPFQARQSYRRSYPQHSTGTAISMRAGT
eukprot:2973462-Rhodomonas_salina.1